MKFPRFLDYLYERVTIRLLIKISLFNGIVLVVVLMMWLIPYLYFEQFFARYLDMFWWIVIIFEIFTVLFLVVMFVGVIMPSFARSFLWRHPYFKVKMVEYAMHSRFYRLFLYGFVGREEVDEEIRKRKDKT